ncbi:MAG: riboflavin synthase [Gemmatimonadaceae bacterium]|nr:riboflavin synthase [Gemmatimonadaceae bacterium]
MFTGLVDDVGTLTAVAATPAGRELRIACRYTDLEAGESIACNGACLTVREHGDAWFTASAVITTLGRTTVADWTVGDRVNLERALRAGDRLGGHLVQGHVDGVAEVVRVEQADDARIVELALPPGLADLMVPHGSITVDGVSLTVNALPAPDRVELSLIEFTLRHTTLGALAAGGRVHVEGDIIGKYVRRLVAPYALQG